VDVIGAKSAVAAVARNGTWPRRARRDVKNGTIGKRGEGLERALVEKNGG